MKTMITRILALLLCVCLLPCAAFAADDDYAAAMTDAHDDSPVTRSDFELDFHFYADGFPQDGMMHYADWEELIEKISIRGVMDSQRFPQPTNRVYFDGGVYLPFALSSQMFRNCSEGFGEILSKTSRRPYVNID